MHLFFARLNPRHIRVLQLSHLKIVNNDKHARRIRSIFDKTNEKPTHWRRRHIGGRHWFVCVTIAHNFMDATRCAAHIVEWSQRIVAYLQDAKICENRDMDVASTIRYGCSFHFDSVMSARIAGTFQCKVAAAVF